MLGQAVFWETAKSIEHLCCEFAKEKKNNPEQPPSSNDKQKISELKAKIKELESKINKTSEEEAELVTKQAQLTKLTNNNSWIIPTLIIGGTILLVSLVIFLTKNKKNKYQLGYFFKK